MRIEKEFYRDSIYVGQEVDIVEKQYQRDGQRTIEVVERIMTNKPVHTRRIKVRLTNVKVGRIKRMIN